MLKTFNETPINCPDGRSAEFNKQREAHNLNVFPRALRFTRSPRPAQYLRHTSARSFIKTIAFTSLLLSLGLTIACQGGQEETPAEQTQELPPLTGGHVLSGSADSPIRIEVFSDLQCPSCREFFIGVIKPVMREYQDKVYVVYHEFPLNAHPYARPAARYAQAAARLGQRQVVSVYDSVFNDQLFWAVDGSLEASVAKALSDEDFQRVIQILRDPDSLEEINETIEKEQQAGMRKGVNSTPSMFISYNGKEEKLDRAPTYRLMKQFLDSYLN